MIGDVHRVDVRSGTHPRPHARQNTADQADAARLTQAVSDIIRALDHVQALLPEPSGRPHTGTIGRHAPESCEPWQSEAAAVYWQIHFGARQLEDAIRADIGLPPRTPPRGGTTGNTIAALDAIDNAAPTMTAGTLNTARRKLEAWSTAIDRLPDIDLADTWVPVPRQPGALPPTCPYCDNFTLRMAVARQLVRCLNSQCRDDHDQPPIARMERGQFSGDGILVFGDGRVVHYRQEDARTP